MGASPPDLELVDPAADAQITMAVGTRLVLRLTENPTTGYRWHYTLTAQGGIECVQDDYVPASQQRGSGGTRSITFRATGPNSTVIEFSLQRAWETQAPLKSFRVLVDIQSP